MVAQSDRTTIANAEQRYQQLTTLSAREAAVVARKAHGMTHQQIGDDLGIKKGTVDSHAHRAREKYGMGEFTYRELRPVFETEYPELDSYTGVLFFYDDRADSHRTFLLPAARAAATDTRGAFTSYGVTDTARLPERYPVDTLPAYLFCEGEVVEAWAGEEVLEAVDTEVLTQIGHAAGVFDANGWTTELI